MGSVSVTKRKIGKTSRGVGWILLSELVFPVTGALGQVLGTVLIAQLRRRRRKLEPALTAKSAAAAGPGPDGRGVMLAGLQAREFHDACLSHALTLGLPPAEAALLADACLGAVNSRGPT